MTFERALLFGKLPAHGDFVARGMDGATRERLDGWLAESIAAARDTFGERFDDRYDSAPAWRFALREEGDGWLAGAMAPSVDAVGRRFPILVACRTADEAAAPGLAQACEDAIYQSFQRGLSADELHAGLVAIAEQAATPPPLPGWWTAGNEQFAAARIGGAWPGAVIRAMLGGDAA